jgi:hypothetical protein
MRHFALLSALVLTSAVFAGAQEAQGPTPQPDQIDTKAPEKAKNADAVYGRIKTVTTGQKVVIDVDKGRDKTFNLADSKVVVRIAEGLAVGDPVKVIETKTKGNHTVDIVRNTESGGEQRSRSADSAPQK